MSDERAPRRALPPGPEAHPALPPPQATDGAPTPQGTDDEPHPRRARWLKRLLPLLLLALGIGLFALLVLSRPKPEQQAPQERKASVVAVAVEPTDVQVIIEARGRVMAAQRAAMSPHVAGPVAWRSPELMPGGRVREGQPLLRVDPSEYRLALRAQSGQVSQAALDVRREKNRQRVSAKAWRLYRQRRADLDRAQAPDADTPMALNLPQLAAAEQALDASQSQLEQARLNLARTRIVAPFNASVESEEVALGQRVAPGQTLVTLVGTDYYWVRAAIDPDDIGAITIPGVAGAEQGSKARVSYDAGIGRQAVRNGHVLRLQSELDPNGSMAQVLIHVRDPLGLQQSEQGPPLLIGALVDVAIEGERRENVYRLSQELVHEDNTVWVVGEDQRLQIREVEVMRRQGEDVLVSSGLSPGDQLVRSPIDLPTPGLKLEVTRDATSRVEAEAQADKETASNLARGTP